MFEEEIDNKVYQLFISQSRDPNKEVSQFLKRLDDYSEFLWENHSKTSETDKNSLNEQMKQSEVVVVLSGLYSTHKDLVENIFTIAQTHEKPVVLIRPYGMENVPLELEEKANAVIGWNVHCIVGAIKGVLGLGDDDELCEID